MKFAILADVHLGPEGYHEGVLRKINKNVELFIDNFVQDINSNVEPSFVIVLGDLIEEDNREKDRENMSCVVDRLTELECPVYYVAGNNDLKNISVSELEKLLGLGSLYYSFDSGEFHFIVLYSKVIEEDESKRIEIPKGQKAWLQDDLDKTDKKSVVFIHHSLADQDLEGNPWFEERPSHCLVENRKEIRSILEESGKVLAVFNSHLHWDKKNVHNGIPYFTVQSLVENEGDEGVASEAYAAVNIDDESAEVEVKGNYSKKFSYKNNTK